MQIVAEVKVANGASRKITCCDPNLPAPVNGSGTCEFLNNCSTDAMIAVLERMDAFLPESDEQGRMPSYGKVAVAAIVGNEDGAHLSSAQLFQSLNDVGWTIPAVVACYWVEEAMGSTDFKDLEKTPEKVTETAKMVAGNAAHLAGLLQASPYPG